MKYENCDVWIEVGGQRVEEYGTKTVGKEVSCWIPCEEGQVRRRLDLSSHSANGVTRLLNTC